MQGEVARQLHIHGSQDQAAGRRHARSTKRSVDTSILQYGIQRIETCQSRKRRSVDRMKHSETFSRIRTLHGYRGSRLIGASRRHKTTYRGASEASGAESESARTKAETKGRHAFRFGPRGKRPLVDRLF